ncbi:MAG TPA: tyrosine-type recombinase/integrase [Chitinophagaceae bacterium]|nr:tyrosine-type recombinase/integrase [Chitinophagaceae bacterium]
MGIKEKSPKGEISIENYRGRIRLRWRYNGIRYPLSLPYSYAPENLHFAAVKAAEIKLDIIKGCFDTSLEKYKPPPIIAPPIEVTVAVSEAKTPVLLHNLVEKFNDWTKNIRNINIEHSIDYMWTRRVLEKYINVPVEDIAEKIAAEKWCISTYNKRLNCLSGFLSWLVTTGGILSNPLLEVKRKRNRKKKKCSRREPLTEEEINTFLEAIRQDTFCHKSAPVKHSFYYPFLKFIFLTGVRNSEGIGLKVKQINFNLKQIEICEVLARTTKGSHHAARISKETKTGNTRYLPLTDELAALLFASVQDKELDRLVFISPRGVSIDDRMLQRRIIKPVLKKLGFKDRDLYSARHSFGTRAVEQGMPLTDIAYLMGHTNIQTASQNYVHVGKPATALPTIGKTSK